MTSFSEIYFNCLLLVQKLGGNQGDVDTYFGGNQN